MLNVQIRLNQPFEVRRKLVKAGVWTSVSSAFGERKDAECEISWLANSFNDLGHLLKEFKVEYRIVDEDKVIWEKQEAYR